MPCPALSCHDTGRQCSSAQSCKQSAATSHADLCPLTHNIHHPLSYLAVPHLAHPCVSNGQCKEQAACFLRGGIEYLRVCRLISFFLPQAVSCRPSHFRNPGSNPGQCEIPCGHGGTVTGFSPRTSVSPVSIIPPMLHVPLHLHVAITKLGNLQSNAISEIQKHRMEQYFYQPVS